MVAFIKFCASMYVFMVAFHVDQDLFVLFRNLIFCVLFVYISLYWTIHSTKLTVVPLLIQHLLHTQSC
jgi:hypothetical protein